MATVNDLMGLGTPPALANLLGANLEPVTAAGTTQGTATPIGDRRGVIVTSAVGATGIILSANAPMNVPIIVHNPSGTAANVYPQTGGTINAVPINTAVSVALTTGTRIFIRVSITHWMSLNAA